MTCGCCYRPREICVAEKDIARLEAQVERLKIRVERSLYIAGKACEFLAELSSLHDDTGREAEAIMCDWTVEPGSAGECAARRVVEYVKSVRG